MENKVYIVVFSTIDSDIDDNTRVFKHRDYAYKVFNNIRDELIDQLSDSWDETGWEYIYDEDNRMKIINSDNHWYEVRIIEKELEIY